MYPRNAATPPVIDLGEIVLKSDGTQQTTGAAARVKIGTGAWGAAAGTLACDATSGIWTYAPTQAETNADYFIVGAYKASCTSISKTVITSNSATSGTVLLAPVTHTSAVLPNLDAAISSRMASYTQPTGFLAATFPATVSSYAGGAVASVTAGVTVTTNNDKTGYSLTAGTGLGNQTANITGNLSGSVGSVTGAVGSVTSGVTVTTNNDKTGYSLASGGLAAVTTWTVGITGNITGNLSGSVGSVTGNVGGNVTGSVGSISGVTFPSGFNALTVAAIADGVWDEATSGHTTSGTYGGRIVRATNSNTEVQITGSNHIAADVHEFQVGVIAAGAFAANSLTASALATDAVAEIQSGLATSAALAAESSKITNIENASGYLLAVLAGECADPQTASETYAITVFGSTFTVDMAGQTSTGTRTAPTLTKT
jgi:hypothetical protein